MRRPARAVAAGGLLIAAALGFLMYQGISNNLVYYITPSELLAKGAAANGADLRLGGLVEKGANRWNARTQTLRFVLTDPKGAVSVISHGLPPAMFRAGAGVVVEGTYRNGIFQATTLMVKHCSTYRAPQPGHVPPPQDCVTQ